MAYTTYDPILGTVNFSDIDPVGPGPFGLVTGGPTGAGRQSFYNEEIRGNDGNLGGGTFQYVRFGATLTAGQVVQLSDALTSGQVVTSAILWTGTALSGQPIGVVVTGGATGQWGWVQVQGVAIAAVSGSPTANGAVYWQANGVVSSSVVASKQLVNAQFATTNNPTIGSGSSAVALGTGFALVHLNRPCGQSAIT
jgi:hypothetical protein